MKKYTYKDLYKSICRVSDKNLREAMYWVAMCFEDGNKPAKEARDCIEVTLKDK